MKNILIILLLLLITFTPAIVSSQTLDYKLERPSKLFIGTPFHVIVNISSEITDSVFVPKIDTLDVFILKDHSERETIKNEDKISTINLTFQTFDTGEFTFPELEFSIKQEDTLKTLYTSEFQLIIESVITDSTQTIKDVADPLKISLKFWDYFIPIITIILIFILIKYLVRYFRKKPEKLLKEKEVDKRPAYLRTLELLNDLKNQKLLENSKFLQYHFRLSYIMRFYLEIAYKINAVEMTTNEIRRNLKTSDHKFKTKILQNLTTADKVKFAKYKTNYDESEAIYDWFEDYLISLKKAEEKENA